MRKNVRMYKNEGEYTRNMQTEKNDLGRLAKKERM